jgi:hypothetical protein
VQEPNSDAAQQAGGAELKKAEVDVRHTVLRVLAKRATVVEVFI